MFGNVPFGANPFESTSKPRAYVPVENTLVFTMELLVEGATIVSVNVLEFNQFLHMTQLQRVKRVSNVVNHVRTVPPSTTGLTVHFNPLQYNLSLISPDIIRKHYEIPENILEFIQTLHQPKLPKISIVDSVLSFNQNLHIPVTALIHRSNTLQYSQTLHDSHSIRIVYPEHLHNELSLNKPQIKYLTTAELLELYFTVNTAKTLVVMPIETLEYEMTLHKPIINAYELLLEMHPYTIWKSYEVQREGKKIIVVQEMEYSSNLTEGSY